jgi:pyrroline-5-carboxylate reductase
MKLLLIGGGNMGSALLAGWQKRSDFVVDVVDPKPNDMVGLYAQNIYPSLEKITEEYDGIILAVKPQTLPEILPSLKNLVKNSWVLSIVAGKTTQSIHEILGDKVSVIRCMPNTPGLIGQGMSVCCPDQNATTEQKRAVSEVISPLGELLWTYEEEQMHAVTAVSGSGPAYVFALIEAMQKAGEANGLSSEFALRLAIKTVQGAGALAQQSDRTPTELRQQVTSPKGTTAAALEVLQGENGLDELVKAAITAAANRSKELA